MVIFLSAFPLAILGNLARVIMLVFGSIFFGSAFAIGTTEDPSWFHEGCGFPHLRRCLGSGISPSLVADPEMAPNRRCSRCRADAA